MTPFVAGSDVFSASTDGFVYLWDIRKLVDPVESWFLQPKDSELKLGGISLDFESTMVGIYMYVRMYVHFLGLSYVCVHAYSHVHTFLVFPE